MDKIYFGNVITMDPENPVAEAVMVSDGKVTFVGSRDDAEFRAYIADVVDFGDNYIYPGMIEAHCHGTMAGSRLTLEANLTKCETKEEYFDAIRKFIAERPDFPEYRGAGWKSTVITPNAAMLDEICPDKPVFLNSFDGHSMWVNTAALKKSGIDRECAAKWGPQIVRVYDDGTPTGYISEGPTNAMIASSVFTHDQKVTSMLEWQKFAFSLGFTAYLDAGVTDDILALYKELCDKGLWKIRTYCVYLIPETKDDYLSCVEAAKKAKELYECEYLKVIGMKVFMDGVIEAHTGWLLDSYSDDPKAFGVQRLHDHQRFVEVLKKSKEYGFNVHCHTIGDGAVEFALSCMEEVGTNGMRNAFAHLQIVNEDQKKRMGKEGVVAVVAPLWVKETPFYQQEIDYVGQERAFNAYPVKSFSDAGSVIAFHSDYPISSDVSIPDTIYRAIKRRDVDQDDSLVRNGKECISNFEAVEGFTKGPAYSVFEENRMGMLKEGYIANMTVFDKDFVSGNDDEIPKARVIATVVDGEMVFGEQ